MKQIKLHNKNPELYAESSIPGNITNLAYINNFCKGNQELVKKYIDIYLRLTPPNLAKMTVAVLDKRYDVLLQTIHDMKIHLKCMGMVRTGDIAAKMEAILVSKKNFEELPLMVSQIQQDYEQSVTELKT